MSEQSDELETSSTRPAPEGSSDTENASDDAAQPNRRQSRIGGVLGRVFSPRVFLVALGLSVIGLIGGSAVPVVGGVVRYLGLFLAAFLIGAVRSRPAYLETAFAGAVAGGLTFLIGIIGRGFLLAQVNLLEDYGPAVAGIGVGAGFIVALAGHYFGRDLRKGITRTLDE